MKIYLGCCLMAYFIFACCFDNISGYCDTSVDNKATKWIAPRKNINENIADWKSIEIPKSISVRQVIQSIPNGWNTAYEARAHVLSAITFYDSRPEDRSSLVYAGESRSKNALTLTWRFTPSTDNGIWIQCKYSSTTATLTKQLPIHISSCKVTYDPSIRIDGFPEIKSISCM